MEIVSIERKTFEELKERFGNTQPVVQQLYLVDDEQLGFQLYLLSLAGKVVGTFPVHHTCREGGRHLLYLADELLQRLLHQSAGDVLRGIGGIYLMFQVVRGSGGTQPDGGNVLLRVILEFLNPFRGLARTDYHHPRSKRVEGTGMAYFQLLLLYPPADVVTRMSHNLERCPSQRFIEIEDFSFFKIHWPLP